MSCTGQAERKAADFYATPWSAYGPLIPYLSRDLHHYDPCCGDGRIVVWNRSPELRLRADGADLYAPAKPFSLLYDVISGVDFLADTTDREALATNPPYSLAQEFIHHGLAHSREMFLLLRISLLESETRGNWWPEHRPNALINLKKRPSFAMHCRCKAPRAEDAVEPCDNKWWLPIESDRPKTCPQCGSPKIAITTSDNAAYSWMYWGRRYQGLFWI